MAHRASLMAPYHPGAGAQFYHSAQSAPRDIALACLARSPQYSAVTDIYASTILALTETSGRSGSISPTDAARAVAAALAPDGGPDAWHRYLPPIRRAAGALAREGRIEILRKGKPVDPAAAKGVIRLRIAAPQEA